MVPFTWHGQQQWATSLEALGPASIANKKFYGKISRNLEAVGLVISIIASLWKKWQARRLHCCLTIVQIPGRSHNSECKTCDFKSFWNLTVRHVVGYLNRALIPSYPPCNKRCDVPWKVLAIRPIVLPIMGHYVLNLYAWSHYLYI